MKYMTLATLIAGVSGFVVIIVAARAFGADQAMAEEFTAYWGLFFAGTGILTGLTQETTRAVAAHASVSEPPRQHRFPDNAARPFRMSFVIGLITLVVFALAGPVWAPRVITEHQLSGIVLLAVGLGSYAIQAVIAGLLSGNQLWREYAGMISLDSASRMVVSVIAWLLGWKLLAFIVVTVMGAVSWMVIVALSPALRKVLFSLADVPARQFLSRAVTAMAASGATAILITGFPTIVHLTHPDTSAELVTAASVIYAVTLTRAPILVPLQQFQSALIVRFVERRTVRSLLGPLGIVWGVGIVGAGLAALLGPWLMPAILGPDYQAPGWLLGLLTLGAACTASLMVTGAATVAMEAHGLYLLGWVVATLAAIVALACPLPLSVSSWLALTVGPALGLVVHGVGIQLGRAKA